MVIFHVRLEVLSEVVDSIRKKSHLHFRRASVFCATRVFLNGRLFVHFNILVLITFLVLSGYHARRLEASRGEREWLLSWRLNHDAVHMETHMLAQLV